MPQHTHTAVDFERGAPGKLPARSLAEQLCNAQTAHSPGGVVDAAECLCRGPLHLFARAEPQKA